MFRDQPKVVKSLFFAFMCCLFLFGERIFLVVFASLTFWLSSWWFSTVSGYILPALMLFKPHPPALLCQIGFGTFFLVPLLFCLLPFCFCLPFSDLLLPPGFHLVPLFCSFFYTFGSLYRPSCGRPLMETLSNLCTLWICRHKHTPAHTHQHRALLQPLCRKFNGLMNISQGHAWVTANLS